MHLMYPSRISVSRLHASSHRPGQNMPISKMSVCALIHMSILMSICMSMHMSMPHGPQIEHHQLAHDRRDFYERERSDVLSHVITPEWHDEYVVITALWPARTSINANGHSVSVCMLNPSTCTAACPCTFGRHFWHRILTSTRQSGAYPLHNVVFWVTCVPVSTTVCAHAYLHACAPLFVNAYCVSTWLVGQYVVTCVYTCVCACENAWVHVSRWVGQ